jgi:hypothetical protein
MKEHVQESKRSGAEFFGGLLQLLATLTLVGTLVAVVNVNHFASEFGIGVSNDPAIWIILVVGLFISSTLAGIGYALGILCAIYDRQGIATTSQGRESTPWPSTPTPPPPFVPGTINPNIERAPKPNLSEIRPTPPTQGKKESPEALKPEERTTPRAIAKSRFWESLTRERHIGRSKSD